MACTHTCRKPNGNQAHCGACHQTFSGITAFDRHRTGRVDERVCVHPEGVGMRLNAYGVWTGEGRPAFWDRRPQVSGDPQAADTGVQVARQGSGTPEGLASAYLAGDE